MNIISRKSQEWHPYKTAGHPCSWKATSICTVDVKYADNVQQYFQRKNNKGLLFTMSWSGWLGSCSWSRLSQEMLSLEWSDADCWGIGRSLADLHKSSDCPWRSTLGSSMGLDPAANSGTFLMNQGILLFCLILLSCLTSGVFFRCKLSLLKQPSWDGYLLLYSQKATSAAQNLYSLLLVL